MSRTFEELKNLNYSITLKPLEVDDGGGWLAEISELPGCCADGETPEEALELLNSAKESWLLMALERGINIPQPSKKTGLLDEYSGKFTLRVPKSTHKMLIEMSQEENVSLNQYVNSLISFQLGKKLKRMI